MHTPKKSLGQNFLKDSNVLKSIIEAADLQNSDQIIEIGPGLGVLTKELVSQAKQVDSIEIDQDLIPILQKKFQHIRNLIIHHQDVLKFKIPNTNYKLIANIPYYLTSPIIRHFITESKTKPLLAVLLVQKEVAEKICDTQKQSLLSWEVKLFGNPTIVRLVSKNCFNPIPKVDSALLKIAMYKKSLIDDPQQCLNLMKICFQEKRKQLGGILSKHFKISLPEIQTRLQKININPQIRAEKLIVEDWINLIKILEIEKGLN